MPRPIYFLVSVNRSGTKQLRLLGLSAPGPEQPALHRSRNTSDVISKLKSEQEQL